MIPEHTRKAALEKVWSGTHRDYRGVIDGRRTIMVLRKGGTCIVHLDNLTDGEICTRLKRDTPLRRAYERAIDGK